ncbi:MAG: acylphosphatase [Archaeoglobaceae archaeon]
MISRIHVYISGRVQGVFFRDSTREKARELGVNGWVRNMRDGRVEGVFEGDEDKLNKMVEWCHEGPRSARVDKVEISKEEPVGEEGFSVKR